MRDTRLDPLPSEMRRRREQAARELETGITWLDGCPTAVGVEVMAALETFATLPRRVLKMADSRLGEENPQSWVSADRLRGDGDDLARLDAVAAVVNAFVWLSGHDEEPEDSGWENRPDIVPEYDLEVFIEVVNDRLLHARVDWVFQDGRFQERGNYVLHSEVLRPASSFAHSAWRATPYLTSLTKRNARRSSVGPIAA